MGIENPLDEVVCLVFYEGGKFLLEQRLDHDNYFGHWTFPGGRVEEIDRQAEDYKMAASIRESDEEIGLIPKILILFTSFKEVTRNGKIFLFHSLHVKEFGGILQNKERGRRNLAWVKEDEVAERIGDTAVDKRILEEFLKYN